MASDSESPSPILGYACITREGVICPAMRAGNYLVVGIDTLLPPACVLCNAAVIDPPVIIRILARQETFHYLPRTAQATLRTRFLSFSEPTALVHTSYCPHHMHIRTLALRFARGFGIASIIMAVGAIIAKIQDSSAGLTVAAVGTLLFLLGVAIANFIGSRGPRLHHLAGDYLYLRGVCRDFLNALPTVEPRQAPISPRVGVNKV